MAIIDQRILIPARQEVVWAYVSDFSKNAEWQADCQGVSYLSTRHDGVGARWRSTTDRGKDTVLEITSWYNGLGYEYAVVDGVTLKNSKGRLRLQEIPEGTVVQWTFSFDGGGVLGGGRAARQYDSLMAASLKALYKQIKAISQSDEIAARSLIREAPDVEARAAYVPRHPSAVDAAAEPAEDAVLLPVTSEPTVGLEDAALVSAIDLSAEPPVAVDDTKPRPVAEAEAAGDERFAPKPESVISVAKLEIGEVRAEPDAASPEPVPEPIATEPPPDRTAAAVAAAAAAAALPPADVHGKSIWEVFGVDRPTAEAEAQAETPQGEPGQPEAETVSEAAEAAPDPQETAPLEAVPELAAAAPAVTVAAMATVIAAVPDEAAPAEPAASPAPPAAAAPVAGLPRQGLRLVQRRAHVKLRRPG